MPTERRLGIVGTGWFEATGTPKQGTKDSTVAEQAQHTDPYEPLVQSMPHAGQQRWFSQHGGLGSDD